MICGGGVMLLWLDCPQKHTKCLDAHLNGLQPLTTNEAALVLGARTKVM